MNAADRTVFYTPAEERINVVSHAAGLVLSVFATIALLWKAGQVGDFLYLLGFLPFGAGLIVLYAASTAYHRASDIKVRDRLRIFDHASIYLLIAGSYTPFTLNVLPGATGWIIFTVTWAFALTGIILKLFFTGRFKIISTLMYVFMGWLIVFAINPLIENLPALGLNWLFTGGIAYTFGALIYSIKKIKFNHAIFHICVLIGSIAHFITVYFYVIPAV